MPLKHLFSRSDLKKRQVRWIEDLLEFDIVDFQHIAGKANVVADELWCNTGDSKTDKHTARQTNDRQEAGVEAVVIRSESQKKKGGRAVNSLQRKGRNKHRVVGGQRNFILLQRNTG